MSELSRSVYEAQSSAYASVRPQYPEVLFETIEDVWSERNEGVPSVLEVGPGSGQATAQMADRGWQIEAFEPGPMLADEARNRCMTYDTVSVFTSEFETAEFDAGSFDVVAAATSWHWVDPAISYHQAHKALRRDGLLALWWNAHVNYVATSHPWHTVIQAYKEIAPELASLPALTPDRSDYDPISEIERSELFATPSEHSWNFELRYTVPNFLRLVRTYASHSTLSEDQLEALDTEIQRAVETRHDGTVLKPYKAYLVTASVVK